jgi:hypothetical protein
MPTAVGSKTSMWQTDKNLQKTYSLCKHKFYYISSNDQMAQSAGRAGAAANQISRVGVDERGSILSTSYRQIDWMGDSNIQETLAQSNFDLREFLTGNLDIFVVLPEDQVKEHSTPGTHVDVLIDGDDCTSQSQRIA